MSNNKPSVEIRGVSKHFNSHSVLIDLNQSFYPGEIIGIAGSNGSGKTTFLKLLCGLILPDSGDVLIMDYALRTARLNAVKNVGASLDAMRGLYWRLSAWQNYIYFSGLKGVFGKLAEKNGKEMFELFKINDLKYQRVEMLSLGMKQRLSVICALAGLPKVIILDEPTTGLDEEAKLILKKFILYLSAQDKTVVLSSHNSDILHSLSQRCFFLENSRLVVKC